MKCMAILFDNAGNDEDNDDTKLEKRAHAEDKAARFFQVDCDNSISNEKVSTLSRGLSSQTRPKERIN